MHLFLLSISYRSFVSIFVIISIFSSVFLSPSITYADLSPVTAKKSDDFVNSLGVATHLDWGTSVYRTKYIQVKAAFQELGLRYYRAGVSPTSEMRIGVVKDLHDSLGMKGVFTVSKYVGDYNTQLVPGSAPGIIDSFLVSGAEGVYAIGGPNEYSLSGRPNWATELKNYQREIYTHIKGRGLSVLVNGSPIGGGNATYAAILGSMEDITDTGDWHQYGSSNSPPEEGIADNAAILRRYVYGPTKPFLVTETGYCTNVSLAGAPCISQRAQAKYTLRRVFSIFQENPRNKSFLYEFVDQGTTNGNAENDWGIIRTDMTRKPAFYAMKNAIKILEDKGETDFTPNALVYGLTGATSNIASVLMQKKDGRFYLAIWQKARVYNEPAKSDITVAPVSVTLTLSAPASAINVYLPTALNRSNPNDGVVPVNVYTDVTTVNLQVPDEVMIVEIGGEPGEPGGGEGGSCTNAYTSYGATPVGYGASYNLFTTAKELLVQGTSCLSSGYTVKVGSGDAAQLVYKQGYAWNGVAWEPYTLTGTGPLIRDLWYTGSATGTIVPASSTGTYVVGYVCQYIGTSWKCGCRDTVCTDPLWQLQRTGE